jgi:hypothetical protein
MKKAMITIMFVTMAMAITTSAFAYDLVLNDGTREFHLNYSETVNQTVIYRGQINSNGVDHDVVMMFNQTWGEVCITILGDDKLYTESLVGMTKTPLAADTAAIGPFVDVWANGQINTNLFLKMGSLPTQGGDSTNGGSGALNINKR